MHKLLVPPAALCLLALGSAACLSFASARRTLYDDLGAHDGIDRIATQAIALYMSDPRLRDDFSNIDAHWLQARFAAYLCQVADGPCVYKGRSMKASHKGLHITQARFDATVEDMQLAMDRAGVRFRTQNRLLARLAPLERDIVTR